MFKATVSSKGQVTIPKDVRIALTIETGDNVIFQIDESLKFAVLKKSSEIVKCPVCLGHGDFVGYDFNGIKNKAPKCVVCLESGQIKASISVYMEIASLMTAAQKYGLTVSLAQVELIPEIKLTSNPYPHEVLQRFQDYYQVRLIEESIPLDIPTYDISKLLGLLQTIEAKEKIKELACLKENAPEGDGY